MPVFGLIFSRKTRGLHRIRFIQRRFDIFWRGLRGGFGQCLDGGGSGRFRRDYYRDFFG
jgi:hypothetical protein